MMRRFMAHRQMAIDCVILSASAKSDKKISLKNNKKTNGGENDDHI